MCIRDERGQFIKAKTALHNGIPEPREAEAWGLMQVFIGRQTNLFTHSLARVSRFMLTAKVFDYISNCISSIIRNKMK
ncbi:hypothetical protein GYH30_052804 [Glycine max]|uniref:Uncharacterized protein n=2 Tax=Glycine subgen. Soja TaxID=1462606 RepID=A0A0R0EKW1_SOYBN|nr:hypothetical protein GYH30_052804 [Glycine max]RZB47537.1 hypothetical protein D0Y65_051234 [Glycine soja]